MKNLHTLAYSALLTPVIALSAGTVYAQQSTDLDMDNKDQNSQHDQDAMQYETDANDANRGQLDSGMSNELDIDQEDSERTTNRLGMQNQGYMDSSPANGTRASNLIGADVRTSDNEDIGEVGDLIIDMNGQVVAVVVSVGGFLGMGEKDVAISWDRVTTSGNSDDQELRVSLSSEELESAPEFERRD